MDSPNAPASMQESPWRIPSDQAKQRLDRYLVAALPDLSRSAVQHLITEQAVLVNGQPSKPGYILREHDEIYIVTTTLRARNAIPARSLPLEIIYEDDDLIVVNKAAGMVVHPSAGHSDDTLVNALAAHYPDLQPSQNDVRPGIVHRLDRDTSGLLLVAKNARTQAALIEQMKRREITKRYQALVEGIVSLDQGSIDAPIGRHPRLRQQMAITATEGREARTHFRVLKRFTRHTLLLLQLETGRTHQIRVHLQAIGHSVVGDPLYSSGNGANRLGLTRQFLHASQLLLLHPTSGRQLEFEAPLPADLQKVLAQENLL